MNGLLFLRGRYKGIKPRIYLHTIQIHLLTRKREIQSKLKVKTVQATEVHIQSCRYVYSTRPGYKHNDIHDHKH